MEEKSIFSIIFPRKKSVPVRRRAFIMSSILFLVVFIFGSITFIIFMGQVIVSNAGQELIKTVEYERLRLEALVNREIAIALKMADSPVIKRYFSNPGNADLEEIAFEEFEAYRRAFSAKTVFWVNDTDKLFYFNNNVQYLINPEDPDNYWYLLSLNETEGYNFNINFNPDLNITNLWINAPVFDNYSNPVGVVGTGINLSDFIDSIYRHYSGTADLYFFNSEKEITGAKDVSVVAGKVKLQDELGKIGAEIISKMNHFDAEGIRYFETRHKKGIAVIGTIPALDWYITAYQGFSITDTLNTGMTIFFSSLMIIMKIIFLSLFTVHESKLARSRALAIKKLSIEESDNKLNK
ncbi:MAG: cache domain-containing protein [Treponema sp.]|nr:cache domain-containing protein [Treponema sp.]